MKQPTSKKVLRIENKKKKIAALLEISKLNDKDTEVNLFLFNTIIILCCCIVSTFCENIFYFCMSSLVATVFLTEKLVQQE